MRVGDVVAAGAVHSWFPFIDAGEPTLKTGELLMAIQAKDSQGRRRSTDANGQPVNLLAVVAAEKSSRHGCWLEIELLCRL